MKKHSLLTCQPDQFGDYNSLKECEKQCSQPVPVPHHPTKKPKANNYLCTNGTCTSGSSCKIDDVTCFPTSDSCADGCLPPSPISQKYECVLGYDGASRSCKQTPQGTYDTLGDCVKMAKCYQNYVAPTASPTVAPTASPTVAATAAPLCWTTANAQKSQCMGGWQPNGDSCIDPAGSNKCSPYDLKGMATYNDDMLNSWVNQCGVSNPPGCQ
jgi:hypothetical protein